MTMTDAIIFEIETLRRLSKIERDSGDKETTWQILRDIADRLEKALDRRSVSLPQAQRQVDK
jgi:hypothetical protein